MELTGEGVRHTVRRCLLASMASAFLVATPAPASAQTPEGLRDAIPGIQDRLEHWLASSDLAGALAIEKLRWIGRPEPAGDAVNWLQLDVRVRDRGTGLENGNARFIELARTYRGALGRDLGETMFDKLVHVSGVPRADAAVNFLLPDRGYSVTFDAAKGRLRWLEQSQRYLRRPVDLTGLGTQKNRSGTVALTAPADDVAARVEAFLRAYFGKMPGASLTVKPLERAYAGVVVEGVRGIVIAGRTYFERLEIGFDIFLHESPPRAVCHIDGRYASGIGSRLPVLTSYTDMDPAYRAELEKFADAMIRELQTYLSRPR